MSAVAKTAKAQSWMFTINNPTGEDDPRTWDARYVSWQLEEGEEGTPHLQGYVEFHGQKRLSGVRKISRGHWEPRMGTQEQAIAYTQKKETRVEGPWVVGEKGKGQGKRSDLDAVCDKIKEGATLKEICEEHMPLYVQYGRGFASAIQLIQDPYTHDDVRGIWYHGRPGAGKSHRAREEHPNAYLKSQNKWFDGYAGQDSILLDDLDKLGGQTLGHYLKIWADKYACTAEVKGSTVNLKHKCFMVTSNYTPDDLWPEDEELCTAIKRRFKVIEVKRLRDVDDVQPPRKRARSALVNSTDAASGSSQPQVGGSFPKTKCKIGKCADVGPCFCAQNAYVAAKLACMEE
jgi:hypothetical protein